jgi:hypothetical protein
MDKAHDVEDVLLRGTTMRLRVDGKEYEIDLARQSDRLVNATPEERADFVVSPSGYGIHWPRIDEDLSIDGLIGRTHTHAKTRAIA